ncbi:MAG: GNAT family N-acetyltransferase [Erysipelotrichaceae bacterium]|nr:GNAT family N-acetyltransferase [Erysipelotrichaceae bacterium]
MRVMKIQDYDQVYDLWLKCDNLDIDPVDESRQAIERYLERNPRTCLVHEEDEKIVGVILGGHDGRRGRLYHLAVDPQYRHKGIGDMLMKGAVQALAKEGIRRIGFFVYKENLGARKLFKREGFNERDDLIYLDKDLI